MPHKTSLSLISFLSLLSGTITGKGRWFYFWSESYAESNKLSLSYCIRQKSYCIWQERTHQRWNNKQQLIVLTTISIQTKPMKPTSSRHNNMKTTQSNRKRVGPQKLPSRFFETMGWLYFLLFFSLFVFSPSAVIMSRRACAEKNSCSWLFNKTRRWAHVLPCQVWNFS
jgi:hypothetical protein